ncbi:helix-turn-helix domain-containing protein [Mariniluteicoccus endophyticus]
MATLQTLDRGLTALDAVSRAPHGLTVAEVAEVLDVHRAIAYRIVATLADHRLVHRSPDGRVRLGAGVTTLAARFAPTLRATAAPLLGRLASRTSATAYLAVAEGDECVVVAVEEPDGTVLRVGYQVGSRHDLVRGASGIALLALRPHTAGEPAAVADARRDGHAVSRGQIQVGAIGVASGVVLGDVESAVGVVALEDLDVPAATLEVRATAAELRTLG